MLPLRNWSRDIFGVIRYAGETTAKPAIDIVPIRWTTETAMNDYFVRRFIMSPGFGRGRMTIAAMPMKVNDLMRLCPSINLRPTLRRKRLPRLRKIAK